MDTRGQQHNVHGCLLMSTIVQQQLCTQDFSYFQFTLRASNTFFASGLKASIRSSFRIFCQKPKGGIAASHEDRCIDLMDLILRNIL
jgi:hypothetical protein